MSSPNITIHPHNNQDYTKIRVECLNSGKQLWEDPSYEATYDGRSDWEWRRPKEIVENPRFLRDHDVKEPITFNLNNLNIEESNHRDILKHNIAVLSALTLNSSIFRFVIPDDNTEFSHENYVGIFHFRFWRNGKFYDVVVDDRLPVSGGELASFIKDGVPVEFWPLLLEKAYTKLCGVAESFSKTVAPEVIVDLTGGISETYVSLGHTKSTSADLETIFHSASKKGSFVLFGRHWHDSNNNMDLSNIYCIRKAIFVEGELKSLRDLLIRVFAPFETGAKEWKGVWSEGSSEWVSLPTEKKEELGSVKKHEFVMPFSVFSEHDWDVFILHVNPALMKYLVPGLASPWYSATTEGKWVRGVSSGGRRMEHLETTFYLNPQYHVALTTSDDDEDTNCTLLVSLLQKTHRSSRVGTNIYIFELKGPLDERVDWDFFKHNNPMVENLPQDVTRELTRRYTVPPGEYLVVVAPNKPSDEGQYILRMFADKNIVMTSLVEKVAQKDIDVRVSLTPSMSSESDEYVWSYFDDVSGEDKVVGWKGLKKVLDFAMAYEKPKTGAYAVRNSVISYLIPSNSVFDTMENKEFSKDLSRSLLAMADIDHSGKLTLQEFQGLWAQIRQWIQIYEMHSDENGFLSKELLRDALDSAGFQLNSEILCSLAIRYSNRDNLIPFDDFLLCTSKLRTVFDYYSFKDPENTNQAVFTLEEWLQKSIYS